MNQQDHDQRSLAWHRYVIARMRDDAALMDRAWVTLNHWISLGARPDRAYLADWQAAMVSGLDAVDRLATCDSEYADAMRQCSPISCVLSNSERLAFIKSWRGKDAP